MKSPKKSGDILKLPKRTVPMITRNFYIKAEVYEAFKEACEKRGVPMSQVIEACMEAYTAGKLD